MNSTVRYLLARASERSTFAGIGALAAVAAPMLGGSLDDATVQAGVNVVTAAAAFALMLLPTGGK